MTRSAYIGLMSGTSLDGVDGVLADFTADGIDVVCHAQCGFSVPMRAELLALNSTGHDELARAALAGNALARVYAEVVEELLRASGRPRESIVAIGAHGQTVRHQPGAVDGTGYTLQLGNPALLAEMAGIDVVADLRSRDVAAGGQGAPLAPGFHRQVFWRPGSTVAVLNVGGISNLSVLSDSRTLGFDCGPGNALMDHWCALHRGEPFDAGGRWAAAGHVDAALLARLMDEPYLKHPPPKSTGRDLFNPDWLAAALASLPRQPAPTDVQATLAEFTAACVAADMKREGGSAERMIVCGGGALNDHLMGRLSALLPGVRVQGSGDAGLPPLQVEAAAFAWLARRFVERQPGNLPSVTGAKGPRVLGALYPAG
jgi:anhydro-N-acetylmuramic acid kinase